MASHALRSEERLGLAIALAAHVALLLVLVIRPPSGSAVPVPERIAVTLSDEVGLTSTSPVPNADAAPDVAPELGEPAPPEPLPQVRPELPEPRPQPVARPASRPAPSPRAAARPSPRPKAAPPPKNSASSRRTSEAPRPKPSAKAGGSRVGDDFLKGVQGAQSTGRSQNAPAATIGPAVRSSLASAISRQLKPHWVPPQGAEADQLVTVLAWNLSSDGSLAGPVRVVRQDGITAANRAQANRHAEQAIRAVELAAPFDLPSQYYDGWKRVSSFRFDLRLSQ